MKIRLSIHKDNMFTFFTVEEIINSENITGDTSIKEQVTELYKIFKLFEDNGYRPQIYIRENKK